MCSAVYSVVPPVMESSWASMNPSCMRSAILLSTRTRATIPSSWSVRAYITKVIRVEEENFNKTIDAGLRIYRQHDRGA